MKKILFVIILMLASNPIAAVSKTATNINKTDKYVSIAGSKVSIIPPVNFVPSKTFSGFHEESSGSSILVMEMPGSFTEIAKGMTKEKMLTRGMTLLQKETLKFKGYDAVLLKVEQLQQGIEFLKWILVFGNNQQTVMINGIFPKEYNKTKSEIIKKSVLTANFNSTKIVNKAQGLKFSVNVSNTKFKQADVLMGSSILYTPDGKVPTQSQDKSLFVVASSIGEVDVPDKKAFSLKKMKQNSPNIEIKDEDIKPISIDNLNGYEISGYSTNPKGEKEISYQVMLFSEKQYFILVGLSNNNFDSNLNLFKTISKTFKRK